MDEDDDSGTEIVRLPDEDRLQDEVDIFVGGKHAKYGRFVFAALGSIPWIGGLFGAAANLHAEGQQGQLNDLHHRWIQEHRDRLNDLSRTLAQMTARLDQLGADASVDERIESEEYLGLVRQGFRTWDEAATSEKRNLIQQLLSNAAGTTVSSDDVVRLFLDWIDSYHEAHFAVIREVHRRKGVTRAEIWSAIHGTRPREDSAEADLFKLLIRDLTLGSVIRQHRETDYQGNFVKKIPRKKRGSGGRTMKSAFDDKEGYELTQLGQQFVHYAMTDLVARFAS